MGVAAGPIHREPIRARDITDAVHVRPGQRGRKIKPCGKRAYIRAAAAAIERGSAAGGRDKRSGGGRSDMNIDCIRAASISPGAIA